MEMSLLAIGAVLLAVGIILELATTASAIGWLMAVAGIVIIVIAVVMSASAGRRR